ncbi:unnamed protein product [Amoebophrya sp. A25]|nr:unnamed protein product [Amoebophrya sp. A25]|eukprot:GSA25T00022107001.1
MDWPPPGLEFNTQNYPKYHQVNEYLPNYERDKIRICRCWQSKKFPFCDDTHRQLVEAGDDVGPLVILYRRRAKKHAPGSIPSSGMALGSMAAASSGSGILSQKRGFDARRFLSTVVPSSLKRTTSTAVIGVLGFSGGWLLSKQFRSDREDKTTSTRSSDLQPLNVVLVEDKIEKTKHQEEHNKEEEAITLTTTSRRTNTRGSERDIAADRERGLLKVNRTVIPSNDLSRDWTTASPVRLLSLAGGGLLESPLDLLKSSFESGNFEKMSGKKINPQDGENPQDSDSSCYIDEEQKSGIKTKKLQVEQKSDVKSPTATSGLHHERTKNPQDDMTE